MTRQMKLCLFLFAFVSGYIAFGQKCKYDVEVKDPFTGKMQKVIKIPTFNSTVSQVDGFGLAAAQIYFESKDEKYFLGIHVSLPGKNEKSIAMGDTLSIALDNGQLISVCSGLGSLPAYQTGYGISSHYDIKYPLRSTELKKLSEAGIIAIKLASLAYQAEVPLKTAEKVKKAANCISL
jgi:hypothetical protein